MCVWQQSQFVSQWDVGVFLPGVRLGLAGQDLQVSADAHASAGRLDDVIHETWKGGGKCYFLWGVTATRGSDGRDKRGPVRSVTSDRSWEGVGELLHVFGFGLGLVVLSPEDDLHGALEKRRQSRH